jgi:uncharacterized membrane protein HdeD (DUF308 family)
MSDPVQPKQDYVNPSAGAPRQDVPDLRSSATGPTGKSGGTAIVIGIVMLIAGIALSMAPTGRIFIGLIVVGVINIIRGIAAK